MMVRPLHMALISALALGAPVVASAGPVAPTTVQHVAAPARTPVPAQAESNDYAQRESQDKQVANYEGGSVVIVLSSGVLLLLLLLILIL